MDRKEVKKSTNVKSFGYDKTTRALEVEFLDGSVYSYSGVPEGRFIAMSQSKSKGTFLHLFVKPKYEFKKVRGPK